MASLPKDERDLNRNLRVGAGSAVDALTSVAAEVTDMVVRYRTALRPA